MTETMGFVDFAVALYGCDGVSAACLALQDQCDADVNIVLLAAYVGRRGRALTAADVDRAVQRVGSWNREVVRPLRDVRKRLTEGPPPAPSTATEAVRARVKEAELQAELLELEELSALANSLGTADSPENTVAAIEAVLAAGGAHAPEIRDAVDAIASAAAQLGGVNT